MKIQLIAVGSKMPAWVERGFAEYAKRLPHECRLELVEVPALKRGKSVDPVKTVQQESERLLAKAPPGACRVALDQRGSAWDTPALSRQLEDWMRAGADVALLVGGPDGLSKACRDSADQRWSLSPLTLPHPLVRVIVAEALYRAWSRLRNHPYHRGG